MDPRTLAWKQRSAEAKARRARSATFWKVLVSATTAAASTAALVLTLADHRATARADVPARYDVLDRTGVTITTAAELSAPPLAAPGRSVDVDLDAPQSGTASSRSASVPADERSTPVPSASPDVASVAVGEPAPSVSGPAMAEPARASATPAVVTTSAPEEAAPPPAPTVAIAEAAPPRELRDPRGNPVDPDDHGVNPNAPAMSAGAGQFTTEAPPWSASAFESNPNAGAGRFTTDAPSWSASSFQSNPEAGAGRFTTEWNIPAYGAWWR